MKNLNMTDCGLVEMNEKEMKGTNGGVIGVDDLALLAVGFLITVAFEMGSNDGAKNKHK